MNIYLVSYNEDHIVIAFAETPVFPDALKVIQIGKLTHRVPECHFVSGPYNGKVYDYKTLWLLLSGATDLIKLDEVKKVRVTTSCDGCIYLWLDAYKNQFCHRHSPIPGPQDGTAWWPYLASVDRPTPGCGEYDDGKSKVS